MEYFLFGESDNEEEFLRFDIEKEEGCESGLNGILLQSQRLWENGDVSEGDQVDFEVAEVELLKRRKIYGV